MVHLGLEGVLPLVLYLGMFAAFLVSVLWRPNVALYLLVFILPMQTGRYKLHEFPLGSMILDVLLLGTILGLAIKGQSVIPKTSLSKFLLALAAFYYLSLWQGAFFIDAPLPLWIGDPRFSNWKNYVEMFLLALVVASTAKDKKQIRNLIIIMCMSVLLVNRGYISVMRGRDLSHFSNDLREGGMLGYAGVNGLAAFQAMFISFLLGFSQSVKKIYAKLGIYALLASSSYCLLFAFSRGGYGGLLIGLLTIGVLKSRKYLVLVVLVLISWQALLPRSVQERITMTTEAAAPGAKFESSTQDRLDLWEDAVYVIKRNPVSGTGFMTYGYLQRVGLYTDTHNYYLKVLVETGAVGIVLFLMLLLKLLKVGASLMHGTDDPFWSSIGLGFAAMIMSAIVLNFFGDRWTYQQVDGYVWVLLGCVIRGLITIEEEKEEAKAGESREPAPDETAALAV
jgi:putative inorganic carbon (HCO3(-)) transporter